MSTWLRLFTITVIIGFAKAQHFIRIIVLAGLGLAGLWMLHTLAQDVNKIYNKFQQASAGGVPKAFLEKRSINNNNNIIYFKNRQIELEPQNTEIDWERILSRDPVGCARSFVCQLVATSPEDLPVQETNILNLIRSSTKRKNWASEQLQVALKYGQQATSPNECRQRYKFCPYSSETMMSLLHMFGGS